MLSKLLFVIGVSAVAAATRRNNVDTRYFITQFNGGEFPMAIETCNPLDVLGLNGYQQAVCETESSLSWSVYVDADCTTQAAVYSINSTYQTGVGTYWDFDCSYDATDAYASVEFSVGTCDTETKVTFSAAVDTCTLDTDLGSGITDDYLSLNVYCNDNIAELQYYDWVGAAEAVCTEDYLDQVRNATTECGYMLTTSGTSVYGQLLECITDSDMMTTDSNEDSNEDDSANVLSFIAAIIATIVATIAM